MKKTALLPRLSVNSIICYTNSVLDDVSLYVDAALLDTERYHAVVEAKQRFESGFNTSRRSNINLKKADTTRDRAFLHLKHLVLAGCYSAKEEQQQAGEHVKHLMERLGFTLYRKNYNTESVSISKLLHVLNNGEHKPAVDALNLQEALAGLEEANQLFDHSDILANNERAEQKAIAPPTRVRKALEQAIRGLWAYIDAQAIINPQQGWDRTLHAVELLNDKYSAELKRHYTFIRKKKEKGEGCMEEQPREADTSNNTPEQSEKPCLG
ncbi:DUF6261 family protein [uncultured Acetobacteroides sp.]|uniref:DUF6261 family protein n=1 Tax=uncultured Acetobacteroides sp. TaxID=1760811 RepID=UPI0029F504B5|nr:DUF6261 family protein [uncultured Acetobacteroides sp.]